MGTKQNESLASAVATRSYTGLAAANTDTDLVAAYGVCCRRIRIVDPGVSGILTLTYADGSTDSITGCVANEVFEVQAAKIGKGSGGTTTVDKVTVFF